MDRFQPIDDDHPEYWDEEEGVYSLDEGIRDFVRKLVKPTDKADKELKRLEIFLDLNQGEQ